MKYHYVTFEYDRKFHSDDIFDFFKRHSPIRTFKALNSWCLQYDSVGQCEKAISRYEGEYLMGKKLHLRIHSTESDIRDKANTSPSLSRSTLAKLPHSSNSVEEEKKKISNNLSDAHIVKESTSLQRKVKNKTFGMLLQQLSEIIVRDVKRRLLSHSLHEFLEKLEIHDGSSTGTFTNVSNLAAATKAYEIRLDALPSFKKKAGTEIGGYKPRRQMRIAGTGDSIEHHQMNVQNVKRTLRSIKPRNLNVDLDISEGEDQTIFDGDSEGSNDDNFLKNESNRIVQKERKNLDSRKRFKKTEVSDDSLQEVSQYDISTLNETIDEEAYRKPRQKLASHKEYALCMEPEDESDISIVQSRETLVWRKRRERPLTIFDVDFNYLRGELDDEDRSLIRRLEQQNKVDAEEMESREAVTGKKHSLYYIVARISMHFFFF